MTSGGDLSWFCAYRGILLPAAGTKPARGVLSLGFIYGTLVESITNQLQGVCGPGCNACTKEVGKTGQDWATSTPSQN